jgi:hypothetical protein
MPSRVKLLSDEAASTTGTTFKNGMGQPPYTVYTRGGYGLGAGATGTKGINIEVSDDGSNWMRGIGLIGGENYTEASTTTQELVDIPDKSVIDIAQYHKYIRAVSGSGMTGTATVVLEHAR